MGDKSNEMKELRNNEMGDRSSEIEGSTDRLRELEEFRNGN